MCGELECAGLSASRATALVPVSREHCSPDGCGRCSSYSATLQNLGFFYLADGNGFNKGNGEENEGGKRIEACPPLDVLMIDRTSVDCCQ